MKVKLYGVMKHISWATREKKMSRDFETRATTETVVSLDTDYLEFNFLVSTNETTLTLSNCDGDLN